MLTALAVIVAGAGPHPHRPPAPHAIRLGALLLLPPLIVAIAIVLLPWTFAVDLRVAQPAAEMGHFFAESFERRTGRPLAIVDRRHAHGGAGRADRAEPAKPLSSATPALSPWVTPQDIATKGAVVVWPATDTRGLPPPAIQQQFPGSGRRSAARVRAALPGPLAADCGSAGA